jgi:predicted HicB family RNase H-like nuclease
MKDVMEYKGYTGSVHYSDEDRVFHGKIEFIQSLVSYEGTDVTGLRTAFEEAVDDYLDLCETRNEAPDIPFKGSFNVRVGSDLHRRAALIAMDKNTNLNKIVVDALEKYLTSTL